MKIFERAALVILSIFCLSISASASSLNLIKSITSDTRADQADDLITPFIETTRQQGAAHLPGRYAHAKAVPSRDGSGNIIAPTSLIMTINARAEDGSYPANFNLPSGEAVDFKVELDTSGELPMLKNIYPDGEPDSNIAVLVPNNNSYIWRLVNPQTQNLRLMMPLNDLNNFINGSWQGGDGSTINFSNGKLTFNNQTSGSYTLTDNRISVKMDDGRSDLIFAAYDENSQILVLTFNGSEQDKWSAMAYRKAQAQAQAPITPQQPAPAPQTPNNYPVQQPQPQPQPQAPQAPNNYPMPQPQPQPQPAPQYPQQPMPQYPQTPVMPQQPVQNLQYLIQGLWAANYNGAAVMTQLQGNTFHDWVNGQMTAYGNFQIQQTSQLTGVMYIVDFKGQQFQNLIQLDPSGRFLTMQYQNGLALTFQRMQ